MKPLTTHFEREPCRSLMILVSRNLPPCRRQDNECAESAEEWVWNTLDYGRPVTLRHLLCVDAVPYSPLAE